MIVKHSKIIGMWGIVEKWGFVIQTFKACVMYGHFDENQGPHEAFTVQKMGQ